jgi:putative hemolysin
LSFVEKTLNTLGIDYHIHQDDYLRVPENGSLIVVSNHPYGGLDGLILASIMGKIRRGIKILANQFL